MTKRLQFRMFLMTLLFLFAATARNMTIAKIQKLKLAGNDVIEVESNSSKGFNFPYYVFIPDTMDYQIEGTTVYLEKKKGE